MSRSKDNETIEIFFSKNHAENEAERLVPNIFLVFFEKDLYELKVSGQPLSVNTFW